MEMQKVEMAAWNRANREKKGDNPNKRTGGENQGGNRKKAQVASAKANTELAESHKAVLARMSARIALMTSVGTLAAVGAAV